MSNGFYIYTYRITDQTYQSFFKIVFLSEYKNTSYVTIKIKSLADMHYILTTKPKHTTKFKTFKGQENKNSKLIG